MRLIGITGGVGAGKSEILKYIGDHYKCRIYLADQVAHEVKEPGQPCYDKLTTLLGTEILEKDGTINKAAMAAKIFADRELLEKVNGLIHPAVRQYLLDRIAEEAGKDTELFFIEAALLIESGYKEVVDEMWYIYADTKVRCQRLAQSRGYSQEKIAQIMASQLSEEEFRASCDFVINNSGSLEESFRQIDSRLLGYTRREVS